ncbi:MAG: hypothetical protein ACHQF2_00995 [Flavobacteriales bacterium]
MRTTPKYLVASFFMRSCLLAMMFAVLVPAFAVADHSSHNLSAQPHISSLSTDSGLSFFVVGFEEIEEETEYEDGADDFSLLPDWFSPSVACISQINSLEISLYSFSLTYSQKHSLLNRICVLLI